MHDNPLAKAYEALLGSTLAVQGLLRKAGVELYRSVKDNLPPLLRPLQARYGTEKADPAPSLLC